MGPIFSISSHTTIVSFGCCIGAWSFSTFVPLPFFACANPFEGMTHSLFGVASPLHASQTLAKGPGERDLNSYEVHVQSQHQAVEYRLLQDGCLVCVLCHETENFPICFQHLCWGRSLETCWWINAKMLKQFLRGQFVRPNKIKFVNSLD